MKVAIDSNVLVYAVQRDDVRAIMADDIIRRFEAADICLSVQAIGELLKVVRRKYPDHLKEAMIAVSIWSALYPIEDTLLEDVTSALELAERHRIQYWDAVILAVSARAGAKALLTEDMQDGATIAGVRLVNPFDPANRELVDALLTPLPGTA